MVVSCLTKASFNSPLGRWMRLPEQAKCRARRSSFPGERQTHTCGDNWDLLTPKHKHIQRHTHRPTFPNLPNLQKVTHTPYPRTRWQQDGYIQWNILSHMFSMLSKMLRAIGGIMHKNIGSYKQCAAQICSQLSTAYFSDF